MIDDFWGSPTDRVVQAGVDRAVFYPNEGPGVAWSGIQNVKEDPAASIGPPLIVDGKKVRNGRIKEGLVLTVSAFFSPVEFDNYENSATKTDTFGFSYRTQMRDSDGNEFFQIHIVYKILASAGSFTNSAIGRNTTPSVFEWTFVASSVIIPEAEPTSHIIIDSRYAVFDAILEIEDILYGTTERDGHLPTPQELIDTFENHAILMIIDNGDGTWTAIGPDSAIQMLDANTFEINWPSAEYITNDIYTIRSL